MTNAEAIALIQDAIPDSGGTWADLGAGAGTFTVALAMLIGPTGAVHAVERDAGAVASLRELRRTRHHHASITVIEADFTQPVEFGVLDGVLMANALHFVPYSQQAAVLRRLAQHLTPAGRIVVVEYDRDDGNQWVPYPLSMRTLMSVAHAAGLRAPVETKRTRSRFGGEMYCAWVNVAL